MKEFKKIVIAGIVAAVLVYGFSQVAHADIVYFSSGHGPVASIFYFIGDLIALPFKFVAHLFE